ncbi:hypothetical protein GGS20DRAFT_590103 [Poronia punctata]|nr:hypothetical protein GGS20DRAFT_590103 [Poronia punctata]
MPTDQEPPQQAPMEMGTTDVVTQEPTAEPQPDNTTSKRRERHWFRYTPPTRTITTNNNNDDSGRARPNSILDVIKRGVSHLLELLGNSRPLSPIDLRHTSAYYIFSGIDPREIAGGSESVDVEPVAMITGADAHDGGIDLSPRLDGFVFSPLMVSGSDTPTTLNCELEEEQWAFSPSSSSELQFEVELDTGAEEATALKPYESLWLSEPKVGFIRSNITKL